MEDYVTFELARKLKEKGYPQNNCFRCYFVGDDKVRGCSVGDVIHRSHKGEKHLIDAPTISQVLKWLREEHHIHLEIVAAAYGYSVVISDTPDKGGTDRYYSNAEYDGPNAGGAWDSFEDCVNYGIEYVLDNLI